MFAAFLDRFGLRTKYVSRRELEVGRHAVVTYNIWCLEIKYYKGLLGLVYTSHLIETMLIPINFDCWTT